MRRHLLALVVAALALVALTWTPRAQSGYDSRQFIFTTPVTRCDGRVRYLDPFTAPFALTIVRAEPWMGSDGANVATGFVFPPVDMYLTLHTSNPRWPAPLHLGFDHYKEFTGRS